MGTCSKGPLEEAFSGSMDHAGGIQSCDNAVSESWAHLQTTEGETGLYADWAAYERALEDICVLV